MLEEMYYQMRELAFKTALFMLEDINDAEDIAQNVCFKFLQNKEQIRNHLAWCKKVTKTEVYSLAKNRKIEIPKQNERLEILEARNAETHQEIIPEFDIITREEAKRLLSVNDYKFYTLMLKFAKNTEKIAKHMKRPVSYVYGLCYRVKRNLVAAKLLNEEYKGTKAIIGYNLHQSILNLIKTLKKKMLSNDIASMRNYFRGIDISKIPRLDIVETLDYDIHLIADKCYDLYIAYKNSKDKVQFCIVDFKIDIRNRIEVTRFYSKPALVIEIDDPQDNLMKEFKPKRKGLFTESKEEAKSIIKKFITNPR